MFELEGGKKELGGNSWPLDGDRRDKMGRKGRVRGGGRKEQLGLEGCWGQDRDFGEREGTGRSRWVVGIRRRRRRQWGSWRREEQKRRFGGGDR